MYITKRKIQEAPLSVLDDELFVEIGKCIQSAIECDIPELRAKLDLMIEYIPKKFHWNVVGQYGWNYIFARLMSNNRLTVIPTNCSGWRSIFIYDKDSGFLLMPMREKRFKEIQSQQLKRLKMHYTDALAKTFNSNMQVDEPQLCFNMELGDSQISLFTKEFIDEDQKNVQVRKLLKDFDSDIDMVKQFAIVLFDSKCDHVSNLRVILISPDLDIVEERNLNSLLNYEPEPVVETVTELQTLAQNPERNLKLKSTAQNKKITNIRRKEQ